MLLLLLLEEPELEPEPNISFHVVSEPLYL